MFSVKLKATDEKPAARVDVEVGDAIEFGMTFTLRVFQAENLGAGLDRWEEKTNEMQVMTVDGDAWNAWQDQNDYEYIGGLAAAKLGREIDE